MVRSSLPFNSPLITTDLPMCTTSLAPDGRASGLDCATGVALGGTVAAGGVGDGGAGGLTASSRFHIFHDLHGAGEQRLGARPCRTSEIGRAREPCGQYRQSL